MINEELKESSSSREENDLPNELIQHKQLSNTEREVPKVDNNFWDF